jgi:thiol:disulfide interchange protein DsbD
MNIYSKSLKALVAGVCSLVLVFMAGCSESKQHEGNGSEEKIKWIHSETEGLALSKQENKPVLIDFYADWCPPCKQMDKVTFQDKGVIDELDRFVAIKADMSRPSSPGQAAGKKYGISAYPTFILLDSQGRKKTIVGYTPPKEFLKALRDIR